ncbi:MAG: class I SAM-dependent methyltransferase [Pseudomonadota bacterium]|nr:class I SAM-dependent methyltransferase [Pseudomonadota bacterium]
MKKNNKQDRKGYSPIIDSVCKKAYAYAKDIDFGNDLAGEIGLLANHLQYTFTTDFGEKILQSKYTIIYRNQLLKFWDFEGIPLSVRILYYYGVLEGLFTVSPEDSPRWPEFADYMEEFRSREKTLKVARMLPGWVLAGEDEFFWKLAMTIKNVPGDFCELGAWSGKSTMVWCGALRFLDIGKRLLVVDNWQWGKENKKYPFMTAERDIFAEFKENLTGFETYYRTYNTLTEFAVEKITADLAGKGLSLLFHDASHSYSEVYCDIASYLPLLNENGFLVVHDYNHPDFPEVRKAIADIIERHTDLNCEGVFNSIGVFRKGTKASGSQHTARSGLCICQLKDRQISSTADEQQERALDTNTLKNLEDGYKRYNSYIRHANKHDLLEVFLKDYITSRETKNRLSVLDIGAGTGRLTRLVLDVTMANSVPLNVVALEPCKSAVLEIRENVKDYMNESNNQKIEISATDFYSFREQTKKKFDLILLSHSSYYFEDVSMLLHNIMSMLKEKGECIFVATSVTIMQNRLYQTIYRKLRDLAYKQRTFDSDGFFTFAEHIELKLIAGNYRYSRDELDSSITFSLEEINEAITALENPDDGQNGSILETMSFLWRYPVSALLAFRNDWLDLLRGHRKKEKPIVLIYKDIVLTATND